LDIESDTVMPCPSRHTGIAGGGPSTDLRTVLQSLALSAAIQVGISPLTVTWIVPIRGDLGSHAGRVALWFFITVLVVPLLAGLIVARASDLLVRGR
jgi:hypothetical protein